MKSRFNALIACEVFFLIFIKINTRLVKYRILMFAHPPPVITSQTPTPWETPRLLVERRGGRGGGT